MTEQPTTPDTIRLTGVSATGYHGVFDHERREGQTFVVDLVIELDTRRAAATDDLDHTLNYGTLAEQVVAVLRGEPANLIETVAERIAATVLAHPQAYGVEVTVHKPQAPITVPFGDVEVRVRRDRNRLPAAEPLAADARPWQPEPAQPESTQPESTQPESTPVPATHAAPALSESAPERPEVEPLLSSGEHPTTDGRPTTGPIRVSGTGAPATAVLPAIAAEDAGAASAGAALAGAALAGMLDLGDAGRPTAEVDADTAAAAAAVAGLSGSAPVPVVDARDPFDLPPTEPTEVVLALGSNLGNAQDTLRSAVAAIAAIPGLELLDVSALARTAPVGGPEQPDYLNAVLIARTTLAPRELLHATAAIEQEHGRERLEHWGPRTLDIDIIAFGGLSLVTDDLELPHPRAHERAFVLQPWAQIRPDAVLHGLGGGPVAQLAATAPDREGVRWLALDWLTQPVPAAPESETAAPEHDPLRDHPALFDIPPITPDLDPERPAP